jgi:hypothetical protein
LLLIPVFHSYCETVKNITVTVEDEIYRKARRKAAALDTSVSRVVAAYLRSWTSEEGLKRYRAKRLRNIFALVSEHRQPGPAAAPGSREELYAERFR